MKKIPTIFEREFANHRVVGISNKVTPGMEWVLKGEGAATVKYDGACVVPELFGWTWSEDVLTIDDGDYQGALIFVIHREIYQPSPPEYMMTCAYYGSCSGCDVLMDIQCACYDGETIPDGAVADFMALCKDIVANLVHPFKMYYDEGFEEMEV